MDMCKTHKRYKIKNSPRVPCKYCWQIYLSYYLFCDWDRTGDDQIDQAFSFVAAKIVNTIKRVSK